PGSWRFLEVRAVGSADPPRCRAGTAGGVPERWVRGAVSAETCGAAAGGEVCSSRPATASAGRVMRAEGPAEGATEGATEGDASNRGKGRKSQGGGEVDGETADLARYPRPPAGPASRPSRLTGSGTGSAAPRSRAPASRGR